MCNQCEFLFINGVGCHETGCPNTKKKAVDCYVCGYEVTEDDTHEGCVQ